MEVAVVGVLCAVAEELSVSQLVTAALAFGGALAGSVLGLSSGLLLT